MGPILLKLTQYLKEVVKSEFDVDLAESVLWEPSAKLEFGDLSATIALKLAKQLEKSPVDIAEIIKSALEEKIKDVADDIRIVKPGFINIFLSSRILSGMLDEFLKSGRDFFKGKDGRKVLIEYVSANPTGPLSVAHGRQAVVGDAIASVLEFCGDKVTREYYLNDAGTQLTIFTESVKAWVIHLRTGNQLVLPDGGYKGEYLRDVAQAAIDENIAENDITSFSVQKMVDVIKASCGALGLKDFDIWFSQQKLIDDGHVEGAISFLKDKGLIYEDTDAVWFKSTDFGDDKDRVIRKADGDLTYFASDIAYHKDKLDRGYDFLIDLWGPDHHGYIARVQSAIKAMGYPDEMLKVIIIQLVTLKTKERMSKRAGKMILVSELVDDVGKDAARFYYLSRRNSSHLEFDVDLAKEASVNNPLYYVQYVCARISSIMRKAEWSDNAYDFSVFTDDDKFLLRNLFQFYFALQKAYSTCEPVFIIEYLKSLAAVFHKFYECNRVLEGDLHLMRARLVLLRAVYMLMSCGLGVLGISVVDEM
ncbi:MAG: arginine--tRNA ligase [Candidatus Omnitrophota bacterium]